MDRFVKAIERQDDEAAWEEFLTLDVVSLYYGTAGELVKSRIVSFLVDLPCRMNAIRWKNEYHDILLDKIAGCTDLLTQVLRRVHRERATRYLCGQCDISVKLLDHFDYHKERALFLASLNALKPIGSPYELYTIFLAHDYSYLIMDLIEKGSVDLTVLKALLVIYTDQICEEFFLKWSNSWQQDSGIQLYQAVVLCTLLGNLPLNLSSACTTNLFDGIQKRLGSVEYSIRLIAQVLAEFLSRILNLTDPISGQTRSLNMKVDYIEAIPKDLLGAFNYARSLFDLQAQLNGHCTVLFDGATMIKPKKKPKDEPEISTEKMAKNDKARVKPFLAEALQALGEHDKPDRRAEAINTLLRILPKCDNMALSDFCCKLVDTVSLLGDLFHLNDVDNKLIALRIMTTMRLPEAMSEKAVNIIFGRQIGICHKTYIISVIVRSSQFAIGRRGLDHHIARYLEDVPTCSPHKIVLPFIDRTLLLALKRFKYLSDHEGLIGSQLLTALGTMLIAVPGVEYPRIARRIGELVRVFVLDKHEKCPKALRRSGLVLLIATASFAPNASSLSDLMGFFQAAGDVCQHVLENEQSEEVKMIAGNLAGLLQEKLTVDKLCEELLRQDIEEQRELKCISIPF
jgi:hypothetical protein